MGEVGGGRWEAQGGKVAVIINGTRALFAMRKRARKDSQSLVFVLYLYLLFFIHSKKVIDYRMFFKWVGWSVGQLSSIIGLQYNVFYLSPGLCPFSHTTSTSKSTSAVTRYFMAITTSILKIIKNFLSVGVRFSISSPLSPHQLHKRFFDVAVHGCFSFC